MVQELPKQPENDVTESRALNFSPEASAPRVETPLFPTSREEERQRGDILSRYPTRDTAFNYIPRPNEVFGGNDRRFENLTRGSRQFTAESLALSGYLGGQIDMRHLGARRAQRQRGEGRGEETFGAADMTQLADILSSAPGTGDRTRAQAIKPSETVVADMQGFLHTIVGKAGDNQVYSRGADDKTPGGRTRDVQRGSQNDEIDIFAQIKAKNDSKPAGPTDLKNDAKTDAKADPKVDLPREVKVDYPDGKGGIEAKRDKDGNLIEFTLKDKNGEMNYHKDDAGRWIKTDRFGVESIVNGKFELNGANELIYKKPNGDVHVHKTDGTISKGRELQDGSTVTLDDSGKKVTALNRKDGSKVECEYDKDKDKNDLSKVVETDKTGNNRVTWTKDDKGVWQSKSETKDKDGQWKDDGKPSQERRNLELNINGKYTYEDKLEFKHVLNGDGTERIEPKVTVNEDGTKTVEIQYPDNKGFRTLTLDKDNKITKFTEQDEEGKRTYFKDKQGDWYLRAGLRNVKVGGDFQLLKNGDFVSKDGDRYDIQGLDGNVIHEKVNSNGTRIRYNDDNTVSKLTRKDGSVVDVKYENGEKKQFVDTNKDETARTVWTKNDKGTWTSETQQKDKDGKWVADGKKSEERKDVEINGQGLTIATDLRGFKHVIGPDGQKLNEGPNGSKFTFDEKGRIESITYGPGANRQFKFHYDNNDNLDRVEVRDGKGNLQQTRTKTGDGQWKITKADGSDGGVWKGDMKLSPEGNFMQQSEKDKASGQWQVITPGYDKYNEKVSSDGKHFTRTYADKSVVESDKLPNGEERVTKITRGKESREFRYDSSGKLTECVDTTAKGTTTWKPEGDKVKIYPNGDVAFEKGDGSAVIKKGNFSTVEIDKDGDIRKVTTKDGKTRSFEYENIKDKKELVKITDTRPTKDGEKAEVWTRKKNSDGSVSDQFVSPGAGGKEKVRTGVEVMQDGDYKYKGTDGKDRIAKVGKSDDATGFSENVDEARERLMESMESHLDEPRKQRMQQMMARFEQRGRERVEAQTAGGMSAEQAQAEWDQKIAKTYDHLAHMVSSNEGGTTYDAATRAKLAETCVYSMAWPVKANDQGNWGCCWQISGVYLGVIQHPDKMASMLDQLATKGTFTDTAGKTWNPPKNLLSFTDQGGNWTVGNCGNGRRNPCSEIWTSVAAMISNGGTRMDRGASGGSMEGCMRSMKAITGDTWNSTNQSSMTQKKYQQDLLMKGGVILFSPGHMYLGTMEKNNGQWQIVSSLQHGDQGRHLNGTLTDLRAWNVTGGGRGRYTPDIPAFPNCNDKGVGPNSPNRPNQPRGPNRWRNFDDYPDNPGQGYNPGQWNNPRNWNNPDGSPLSTQEWERRYWNSEAEKRSKRDEEEMSKTRKKKDVSNEEQPSANLNRRRRRF